MTALVQSGRPGGSHGFLRQRGWAVTVTSLLLDSMRDLRICWPVHSQICLLTSRLRAHTGPGRISRIAIFWTSSFGDSWAGGDHEPPWQRIAGCTHVYTQAVELLSSPRCCSSQARLDDRIMSPFSEGFMISLFSLSLDFIHEARRNLEGA